MKIQILILVFCFIFAFSFDSAKFEKCDQKPFCKRLRDPENKSFYFFDRESVRYHDRESVGTMRDKRIKNNDQLSFKITPYEQGIFRLRISENAKDLKKRNEVKDVLSKGIREVPLKGEGAFKGSLVDDETSYFHIQSLEEFTFQYIHKSKGAINFNYNQKLIVENQFRNKTQDANSTEPVYGGETAIGFDIEFPGSKNVYGIPERATDLSLNPTIGEGIQSEPYRLYNLDVYKYDLENPIGLYGSVPFLMSVSELGAFGVFHLNPSETFIDISHGKRGVISHWMTETGLLDLFFLPGPTPKDVLAQYSYLTGTPQLPQLFSLGYHQCRWNYKDEEDVKQVNEKFNENDIPYDVIWLDIEHTDDKKYFTWDKTHFPTPLEMQKNIENNGRKMVTISDPHIKRAAGYHVHDEATKKGYYVKKNEIEDYEGHCWPGSSSWLDFFNPEVRDWYSTLYAFDKYQSSSRILYTWIDMNEPSVFSGPEVTMDKHALHHGGIEHREVHNQYGFYQALAVFNGHVQRTDGKDRPFILTRSFFAGSQRHVAIWTGDNIADWKHLDKAQPMLMSLGISGLPFVGADVGGFFDNPTEELLVRWYQSGAFYPFFRGHAELTTKRKEPYLFGTENTKMIREAILRRYSLIQYYYTTFYYTSYSGAPVLRPIFFDFPNDVSSYRIQDEFLIGSAILVKPVITQGQTYTNVYLPPGKWYDYEDGTMYDGFQNYDVYTPLNKIAVFQKGGTILPLKKRVRRSTALMEKDPYTLQVALSAKGNADGDLYIDDGHSYKYREGKFTLRKFSFTTHGEESTIESVQNVLTKTGYEVFNTIERIVIYGYPKEPTSVSVSLSYDKTLEIMAEASIEFEYKNNILTLKKPNVGLDAPFKILIRK